MPGIITLLDKECTAKVRAVQDLMAQDFGVRRSYPGDVPHFTYHLAESYDVDSVLRVVERIASATRPFSVATSGFGVFTGAKPTLYIPIACGGALASLHECICKEMALAGQVNIPYYRAGRLLPHITIAQGNVPPAMLPDLLAWLAETDFSWDVPVTNLAVAEQTLTGVYVFERWELK